MYWRWKSRKKAGRPNADRTIRDLIRRMCQENSTWGAPRIQSELPLLGHKVSESTVAKHMNRQRKPPSQRLHGSLLRDRDGIYGEYFCDRVEHMGTKTHAETRARIANEALTKIAGPV